MRGAWLVLAWVTALLLLGLAVLPLLLPLPAELAALQAGWDTLSGLGWGVPAAAGGLALLFGALYSRAGGFGAALARAAWLLAAAQWLWALAGLPAGLPQFGLGLGVAALGAWWGRPPVPRMSPAPRMPPKPRTPPEQVEPEDSGAPEPLRFPAWLEGGRAIEGQRVEARSLKGQSLEGSAPQMQVAQGQDWTEQGWTDPDWTEQGWAGQVWWDEGVEAAEPRRAASD